MLRREIHEFQHVEQQDLVHCHTHPGLEQEPFRRRRGGRTAGVRSPRAASIRLASISMLSSLSMVAVLSVASTGEPSSLKPSV